MAGKAPKAIERKPPCSKPNYQQLGFTGSRFPTAYNVRTSASADAQVVGLLCLALRDTKGLAEYLAEVGASALQVSCKEG